MTVEYLVKKLRKFYFAIEKGTEIILIKKNIKNSITTKNSQSSQKTLANSGHSAVFSLCLDELEGHKILKTKINNKTIKISEYKNKQKCILKTRIKLQ